MRFLVLTAILALGGGLSACGSGDDKDPLAEYAGWYDVTEAFASQAGNQCPPAPGQVFENTVDVRIDGNIFEARFTDRWSVLKGEIREDASFISSGNLGPEATLRFSGHFEQITLIGSLVDVQGAGCSRTFSVNGQLRGGQ